MRVTKLVIIGLVVFAGLLGIGHNVSAAVIDQATSTNPNGFYNEGDQITVILNFSEDVYTVGTTTLVMSSGILTSCTFSIASTTPASTASCVYTVADGDSTTPLNMYIRHDGITNNIYDTTNTLLTSFIPVINLDSAKSIIIDTTKPRVNLVSTSLSDGYYDVDTTIPITVQFNDWVYGDITLSFNSSSTASCVFSISSSSPATSGSCNYVISVGDSISALDVESVTGVFDRAENPLLVIPLASQTTNGISLSSNQQISINTSAPRVSSITSNTPNGSYKAGDDIIIDVNFSEDVYSTSDITLTLNTSNNCVFSIASSTPVSTAPCTYTVQSGDTTSDLNVSSISGDIYGATTTEQMVNFRIKSALASNSNIVLDGIVPTIGNITTTKADGTYGIGEQIELDISFSELITTTATSTILLNASATANCVFSELSIATTTTSCIYTVVASDSSADLGISSITSTISDVVGNLAISTSPANTFSDDYAIVINTTPPVPPTPPGGGGGGGGRASAPGQQVLGVKIYSYSTGRVIKTENSSAVYHIGDDGLRHLYVNEVTFWTWHTGEWADQGVEIISQEEFDAIEEGGHVTVQADTKLIRFNNSGRVYMVSEGIEINYMNEEVCIDYYGDSWEDNVITIQNGFENDYSRGLAIVL